MAEHRPPSLGEGSLATGPWQRSYQVLEPILFLHCQKNILAANNAQGEPAASTRNISWPPYLMSEHLLLPRVFASFHISCDFGAIDSYSGSGTRSGAEPAKS